MDVPVTLDIHLCPDNTWPPLQYIYRNDRKKRQLNPLHSIDSNMNKLTLVLIPSLHI